MRLFPALFLLAVLMSLSLSPIAAQVDPSIPATKTDTVSTTSSSTTDTAGTTGPATATEGTVAPNETKPSDLPSSPPPAWLGLVRLAAIFGPWAMLLLAWGIGGVVHIIMVNSEHSAFPSTKGSRLPQVVPAIISGGLFLLLGLIFVFFEYRTRNELSAQLGGVSDIWRPVSGNAVVFLFLCLTLALLPWLFAKRADSYGKGN